MKAYLRKTLQISLVLALTAFLAACEKFEGEQEIPAYIKIDTIGLKHTAYYDGSLSAVIKDAWVYVDDQLIGGFELPVTVPVLDQGKVNIKIRPGIMLNGMINTRAAYAFFDWIELNTIIAEDSITYLGKGDYHGKKMLTTSYTENAEFVWQENFEDAFISLDTTGMSTVNIELTPEGSPHVYEGLHSGQVIMTDDDDVFEAVSAEAYELNMDGTDVFLEMSYKNNSPFTVGLVIYENEVPNYHALLVYKARDDWNKVYINLTQAVSAAYDAIAFQIFLGAGKNPDTEETRFYFDNIRLIQKK